MRYIDLHTHSTASDGSLSPSDVADAAKNAGLSAFALTDHDSVYGLEEARNRSKLIGIEFVNGIEISAEYDVEIHMLGLDFRSDCKRIESLTKRLLILRDERNSEIIEKLASIGFDIDEQEIKASSGKSVGRVLIANVMIQKGYVSSIKEAFDKYLGIGKPAYVKRKSVSPKEAIEQIHSDGGKAFVAHLNQIKMRGAEKLSFLTELKSFGLDGIEGYYTEYSDEQSALFKGWANSLGLILSGGSDFHGKNKEGHDIGFAGEGNRIPYDLLDKIRS